jgi:hypothetical protein
MPLDEPRRATVVALIFLAASPTVLIRRPGYRLFFVISLLARSGVVRLAMLTLAATLPAACGSTRHPTSTAEIPGSLLREARPIGAGPRFHTPASGPIIGRCQPRLGPRIGVHVELFAANHVVILPAGIGVRPPLTASAGQITHARCYGDLVTLGPTGVVLVRAGERLSLSDLFRTWGQPLSRSHLASFTAPMNTRVRVFINGRRWHGEPGDVALGRHFEIVLEVGPHVPPHTAFTFPPGV